MVLGSGIVCSSYRKSHNNGYDDRYQYHYPNEYLYGNADAKANLVKVEGVLRSMLCFNVSASSVVVTTLRGTERGEEKHRSGRKQHKEVKVNLAILMEPQPTTLITINPISCISTVCLH